MNAIDPSGYVSLVESTMIMTIISTLYTIQLMGIQAIAARQAGVELGDVWGKLLEGNTWLKAMGLVLLSFGVAGLIWIGARFLAETIAFGTAMLPALGLVMATFMTAGLVGQLREGSLDPDEVAGRFAVMIAVFAIVLILRLSLYVLRSASRLISNRPTKTTAVQKYYPDNDGFLGETRQEFLLKGQRIDRYGGSDSSRFFSPIGTPEASRALPPGTSGQPLRTFEVIKPFEVEAGTVAPAFDQIGLGTQYRTPVPLETLLNRGIIVEIP